MVKIAKTDVRYALRDIIKDEMKKQQKSDTDKAMNQAYEDSYSDYCPYCHRIATIDGSKEETEIKEVKKKKYLTGKCENCEKEIYVRLFVQPPASILGEPSVVAYFYTKEYVYGEPEIPPVSVPNKTKLQGGIFRA